MRSAQELAGLRNLVARRALELEKPNPNISDRERDTQYMMLDEVMQRLPQTSREHPLRRWDAESGRLTSLLYL